MGIPFSLKGRKKEMVGKGSGPVVIGKKGPIFKRGGTSSWEGWGLAEPGG